MSLKILIAFPNKNLLNKQLQVKNHNLKRELNIENWNRKKNRLLHKIGTHIW